MIKIISFISSTLITNIFDDPDTPMLNNNRVEIAETPSMWYNIIISININIILMILTIKLRQWGHVKF